MVILFILQLVIGTLAVSAQPQTISSNTWDNDTVISRLIEKPGYKYVEIRKRVNDHTIVGVQSVDGEDIIPMDMGCTRVLFYDNAFHPYRNDSTGYYLQYGEEVIPISRGYTFIVKHSQNKKPTYYTVKKNKFEGACDADGKEIISPERGYNNILMAGVPGLSPIIFEVCKGEFKGLCKLNGDEILAPNKYQKVFMFSDRINVEANGSVGICSLDGQEIISPDRGYSTVTGMKTYYQIKKNKLLGACNLEGKEIVPPAYDKIVSTAGILLVSKNGFEGIYDLKKGELISTECGYTSIMPPHFPQFGVYYKVTKDGKVGACDANGKEIIRPLYKDVVYNNGVFMYTNGNDEWISTGISM